MGTGGIALRIGYCEDEAAFYPQMEKQIRRWADWRKVPVEILFYGSGEELLFEHPIPSHLIC